MTTISSRATAAQPVRHRARLGRPAGWLPGNRGLLAIVGVATLIGLVVAIAMVPIAGRGDYGQWLMTSRYYLGESVPDYRVIPNLPPLIPLLLAGIRTLVADPVVALSVLNAGLLAGLGIAFYLAGWWLHRSRLSGLLAAFAGLLMTDRYLELFAFGGLFQAAAVAVMCLSVAALVRGSRGRIHPGWWSIGSIGLLVVTGVHLGTALMAVPVGFAVSGLLLLQLYLRRVDITRATTITGVTAALLGAYWALVLVPGSGDYLTNPASLAYRGPDRLFVALADYPPTLAVAVIGLVTIAIGLRTSVRRRTVDGPAILATWLLVVWGALAASALTGAATDYPRFATVLLAPLVVAAGAGLARVAWVIARRFSRLQPRIGQGRWVLVVVAASIIAAAPLAISRFGRQASVYQPLDASALTAAAEWIDGNLADGDRAVLANVRESKWIEGVTGRTTLFAQPVRYAFRPIEWQRSVDANAVLRSTDGLTNGLWWASFTSRRGSDEAITPTGLSLSVNHGGEMVGVLQEVRAGTGIVAADGTFVSVDRLAPVSTRSRETDRQASITTRRLDRADGSGVELASTVRLWADGTTVQLVTASSDTPVRLELRVTPGMAAASVSVSNGDGRVCFTQIGGSRPCLRIVTTTPDAQLRITPAGRVIVTTTTSHRAVVHVTALTAGQPSVGLGLLDPEQIVDRHEIGAVLLYRDDTAFASRQARLGALGFEPGPAFGPYQVLIRDARSTADVRVGR